MVPLEILEMSKRTGLIVVRENIIGRPEGLESATSMSDVYEVELRKNKASNAVRRKHRQKIVDDQAAIPSS
jgi:hypothetical protein